MSSDEHRREKPAGTTPRTPIETRTLSVSPSSDSGRPSPTNDSRVGTTLAARFELKRKLGEGGMGTVYEALDKAQSNAVVALKLLSRLSPGTIYRLKNEFRSLAGVMHPNLVTLHELFFHEGQWFFTMERVDGVHFIDYVRPSGHTDLERLTATLRQLVTGVRAIHAAGKLHRDLKPSNVLVTPTGRVVIVDFGLVREQAADPRDTDAGFAGTPAYAAPEQADASTATVAGDWYSVGVMLYEGLTGRLPFEGGGVQVMMRKRKEPVTPPSALLEGIPRALEQLCLSLLTPDPKKRAGAAEILDALPAQERPPQLPSSALAEKFVGRERELSALASAFDRASSGKPHVTFVSGPSGIGKTALVEHFLAQFAQSARAEVLAGRCYAHEQVPYKALDSVVDSLSRHLRAMPPVRAAALLPRDVRALAQLFPVLLRVDAVNEVAPRVIEGETESSMRMRAFAALKQLLGALGDRTPTVLFIDDLQWSDEDSVNLLLDLLSPPDVPAILLVATYREEEKDSSPALNRLLTGLSPQVSVETIRLERLPEDDRRKLASALIRSSAPEREADAPLIEWLSRESDGHPLFMAELVRQSGHGTDDAPLSLEEAILRRARALEKPAQRMLSVLCTAGRPIDRGIALAACGDDDGSSFTALRGALLARARADGERIRFEPYHDRVREVIVASLSESERKEIHEKLGQATLRSEVRELEAVVEHYLSAGREKAAALIAEDAALEAVEKLAFHRAIRLLRLALTHAESREQARRLELRLAELCSAAARNREAANYLLSASVDMKAEDSFDARRKAMEHFLSGGHEQEGMVLLNSLAGEVRLRIPKTAIGKWLYIALHYFLMRWVKPPDIAQLERGVQGPVDLMLKRRVELEYSAMAMHTTDPSHAGFHMLHVLGDAPRVGARDIFAIAVAAWASLDSATTGALSRRTRELLLRSERLIDGAELHMRAWFHAIYATTSLALGKFPLSREHFERADTLLSVSTGGAAAAHHYVHNGLVSCQFWTGQLSDYFRNVDAWLHTANQAEDRHFVVGLGTMGALRFLKTGDFEAAYAAYEKAANTPRARPEAVFLDPWWPALIDLYAGRPETAFARFEVYGGTLIQRIQRNVAITRTLAAMVHAGAAAELATHGGDKKKLLRIVRRERRSLRPLRMDLSRAVTEHLLSLEALMEGRSRDALGHLHTAVALYEESGLFAIAMALRAREGALRGGTEGLEAVSRARAFFSAHGVKDPSRFIAMFAPGYGPLA